MINLIQLENIISIHSSLYLYVYSYIHECNIINIWLNILKERERERERERENHLWKMYTKKNLNNCSEDALWYF